MYNNSHLYWKSHIEPFERGRRQRCWHCCLKLLKHLVTMALLFFAIAYVQTISASESYESLSHIGRGTLVYKAEGVTGYQAALLLDTQVDMRVSGLVLRAEVKQTFRNETTQWQEGIYVFPLPENAAVDRMRMRIGERLIEGRIKERAKAKAIYTKAKRSGRAASLIEQERPNMFTTSVANIPPQGEIVVTIEYQQTLRYDNGEFRLRFPLAITPRYMPGQPGERAPTDSGWSPDTDQVSDASRISPPFIFNSKKKINPVQLRVELDAGVALSELGSPTHQIDSTQHGKGRLTITLADGDQFADRDFVLNWRPRQDRQPQTALFSERFNGETYHLVMVLPPTADAVEQTPGRDVIFVIDTSGSMGGVSIRQARQALLDALSHLRRKDRFNVIQFNSITDALFSDVRPASVMNIARARNYVTRLSAGGGTEMRPALARALRDTQEANGNVRQVIFLTDGSVGNESALFKLIHRQLGRSRLYTVGIGSAPNSYFMRKAAEFGKGTYTYINSVQQVGEKMSELFDKLAYPVLQDVRATVNGTDPVAMWPRRLPDIYAGEPLWLSLRQPQTQGKLALHGQRGETPWQHSMQLGTGRGSEGIAALWARNKIEDLMDRLHEGTNKDTVREQVIRVALAHHLVSRFTSLVAVDVTRLRQPHQDLHRQAVAGNLPHGQKASNYISAVAQTATPMHMALLIGSLLLLCATLLFWMAARGTDKHHAR